MVSVMSAVQVSPLLSIHARGRLGNSSNAW